MRSGPGWHELACEPHAGLLDWHRRLIRLRGQIPALADGRMDQVRIHSNEDARWLAVERGPVMVAFNLAGQSQTVPIEQGRPARTLLLSEAGITWILRARRCQPTPL